MNEQHVVSKENWIMAKNRLKDKDLNEKTHPAEAAVSAFSRWAGAGFKEHLLPIIPHDAAMAQNTTVAPENRGKVPGKLTQGGWVGFPRWQDMKATDADLASWVRLEAEHGAGVGLQAQHFPALDIDVLDGVFSETLAALADFLLGAAPERVGRAPKRLLAFRLADRAEPIMKARLVFTLPGTGETQHAIEVLGAGQQYVVAGVHPGTGNPYAWTGGASPATLGADRLTPVTLARVEAYLDQAAKEITRAGGKILSRSAQGSAGERNLPFATPDADGVALIRDALEHMGNDLDYNGWITMIAAVKNALGGDEVHYPIYERWCLAYPGNTPQIARQKWDSVRPPFKVGASYIFEKARDAGWPRYAQAMFSPVVQAQLEADPDLPDFVRKWVYAVDQERFVEIETGRALNDRQFSRAVAEPGQPIEGKGRAGATFFKFAAGRKVDTITYLPGKGALVRDDGRSALNTWRQSPEDKAARAQAQAGVTDADVAAWLDHWGRLVPDAGARKSFLDWMAYVIQHPEQKPNWAVFLGGAPGIGKGLGFRPLIRAHRETDCRVVSPTCITGGYTGWVAEKRLIVVEEVAMFGRKELMNNLKIYITNPPDRIPVNEKYVASYSVPNVAAFVFMSNMRDALALDKGDRRFFVTWSPMQPESASYYKGLADFLDAGGDAKVAAWLHARDVSAFNARGNAPDSADKQDMIRASLTGWRQLLLDALEDQTYPLDVDLLNIEQDVMPWVAQQAGTGKVTPYAVGALLREHGGEKIDKRPDLSQLGATFSARARLWAVRDAGFYQQLDGPTLAAEFIRQRGSRRPLHTIPALPSGAVGSAPSAAPGTANSTTSKTTKH